MIYADCNSTHPLLPSVLDFLHKRVQGNMANPSAIHALGKETRAQLENCRKVIATTLGAELSQIFFNSGASEAISHVFHSVLSQTNKRTILVSAVEHAAVTQAAKNYERLGFLVIEIPYPITLDSLKKLFDENLNDLALVAVMAVNNETGEILPYLEIAELTSSAGVPYLCDTTQLIGKAPFDFHQSKIDYALFSGHKLGALHGTGALLARSPYDLLPLIHGGDQERGARAGTENILGIETLALALSCWESGAPLLKDLKEAQKIFEKALLEKIENSILIGESVSRISGTTLVGFKGIHSQAIQIELESKNIFVTTSAACADNMPETSHVLKAMGYPDEIGRSVIRISFGLCNTPGDYQILLNALVESIHQLAKLNYSLSF